MTTRTPVMDRLLARSVVDEDGCWLWTGAVTGASASGYSGGYGHINEGGSTGRMLKVHRLAFEHYVGTIPIGMDVDHRCHSEHPACPGNRCKHRRCWNPLHLRLLSHADNIRLSAAPNMVSAREGRCRRGHFFSVENTMTSTRANGRPRRQCRTCHAAWNLNSRLAA